MLRQADRQMDSAFVTPAPGHQRQRIPGDQDALGLAEGAAHQGIQRHQKVGDIAKTTRAVFAAPRIQREAEREQLRRRRPGRTRKEYRVLP